MLPDDDDGGGHSHLDPFYDGSSEERAPLIEHVYARRRRRCTLYGAAKKWEIGLL